MYKNVMKLEFLSKSQNESFARVTVAAFVSQLDPTIEELSDVKTAVSEAVTNAIIHGYGEKEGMVTIEAQIDGNEVTIIIRDKGKGIEDIDLAVQPLYTSRPDLERSGMGFTVMETFMDNMKVTSKKGEGTIVTLKKIFKSVS
ncbi:anti-sigma F factor [Hathewaya limosa]|uniref:Anti-sigma F factor n=1 Tax=Hathewaya limosa TaxID=1536 RepID=A0ABU0JRG5_HATLI|nr:anti-sigma F factor [Hathewaya limosa]AWZ49099.1 anti-sigma F factor [Clostridiaceae bacterium 14S0207]MDQ0479655.1 stage II sporulation protein AB (anti-sigma F factor) [Hathewaya limosa]